MAKFELHYEHQIEYDNKMVVDIRLSKRPSKEDYQTMLDAVAKLDSIKDKYLPVNDPKEKS